MSYGPISIDAWCRRIVEWRKSKGFRTEWDNFSEKCMLIVTEVSEAVEASRAKLLDYDHVSEELADVAIRLFDLCGSLDIDLEKWIQKKMSINENREVRHGKRY